MKLSILALSVLALGVALSMGAFAIVAHADFIPDYGGGSPDFIPDYSGGSPDFIPDYSAPDFIPDYAGCNTGCAPDFIPDYSAPDFIPDYGCTNACAPDFIPDAAYDTFCGCDVPYAAPFAPAPFFAPLPPVSFPALRTFAAPSFPVSFPSAPVVIPAPVQQQQQQQQQQQRPIVISQPGNPAPISIVNNNTNTNTNPVTVTTVVPVASAPVQRAVQYVFPQQNAFCTISAGPNPISAGQYTLLTWNSSGASSANLSGVGAVAPSGSRVVQPYAGATYTLTVYGQGGTNTCAVTVNANAPAPSVSLSQIPYTGFDFGAAGNALYWLSLISFAAAAGYLALYYLPGRLPAGRQGMFASAGSLVPARARRAEQAEVAAPAPVAAAPAETPVASPVDPMEYLPVMRERRSTIDTMHIAEIAKGGAPRIVITRN